MEEDEVNLLRPEAVTAYLKRIYEGSKVLNEYQRAVLLERLMHELDMMDQDDFFGTEGWRHVLLGED